jgi:hypothetical protein
MASRSIGSKGEESGIERVVREGEIRALFE